MAESRSDEITLHIDRAVALVLFEFLSRTVDDEDGDSLIDFIDDESEIPALWALMAALESVLSEPMAPDYEKKVQAAREAVLKRFGGAFPSGGDNDL